VVVAFVACNLLRRVEELHRAAAPITAVLIGSVLEAGFLWRVRVLQGPATEQLHRLVRGAGENGKPWLSH
jgi:hypothetical protein